jgi:hypothetical protein
MDKAELALFSKELADRPLHKFAEQNIVGDDYLKSNFSDDVRQAIDSLLARKNEIEINEKEIRNINWIIQKMTDDTLAKNPDDPSVSDVTRSIEDLILDYIMGMSQTKVKDVKNIATEILSKIEMPELLQGKGVGKEVVLENIILALQTVLEGDETLQNLTDEEAHEVYHNLDVIMEKDNTVDV